MGTSPHRPVAVTVEGARLTYGAVPLVAPVSAVQLVVASLRHRVAHRSASIVAGRHCSLSRHPTCKLVLIAAPAALLVLSGLGAVPFPVAALLLGEATSCCSSTPTFPRRTVAPNVECSLKAGPYKARKSLINQRQQASVGLNLDRLVI